MFQVNRSENRLKRLEQRRFSDLNLREREYLQEWLAHQPDALGEELLILQKEFDGFADTRERLDLLALDKDGQLVVIENKLDDSGRDVTWQALKYTAYVSSLTKAQIIDIFQQYLDRHDGGGNAARLICEFLDVEELEEVILNPGHSQRLIFIAAHFRKEVTATVLWLREHQIDARCFKVNLFSMAEELLFDIQPVIPTPEAADFMIQMAEKESEAKSAQSVQRRSHEKREAFWQAVQSDFDQRPVAVFPTIQVNTANWSSSPSRAGCHYAIVLTQSSIAVKLNLTRGDKEENKAIFDSMQACADQIARTFPGEIDWRRMDDSKASRIETHLACDGFNEEEWPRMIEWLHSVADPFEQALRPHFEAAVKQTLREV